MGYIKPNWKIARQISRQHSIYSFLITLFLLILAGLVALITFKIMGYPDAFAALKAYTKQYQKPIYSCVLMVHLIPVNLYSIILTFRHRYSAFHIKLHPNDD